MTSAQFRFSRHTSLAPIPTTRGAAPGYPWVRIDVKLGSGVDLHAGQPGRVHESIAGMDLTDPFTGRSRALPIRARPPPHKSDPRPIRG